MRRGKVQRSGIPTEVNPVLKGGCWPRPIPSAGPYPRMPRGLKAGIEVGNDAVPGSGATGTLALARRMSESRGRKLGVAVGPGRT